VFYPHPGTSLSLARVLGAALLLAALTAGAVALRKEAPYLLFGWLWFLITLLPVIGFVQVGIQALADRYTYIPFIGPFVAIVWGVSEVVSRWKPLAAAFSAVAAVVLLFLALAAAAQARHWKNSETLYLHAIAVTSDNPLARNNLGAYYNGMGMVLMIRGRVGEAEQQFRHALSLKRDDSVVLNNLARARFLQADIAGSIRFYQAAAAAAPNASEVRRNFAIVLLVEGNAAAARDQLETAVRLGPSEAEYRRFLDGFPGLDRGDDPLSRHLRRTVADAHRELGVAFQHRGENEAAAAHFRRALELYPGFVQVRNDLGALLAQEGHRDEAEAQFRSALTFDPRSAAAHSNIGYMLYLKGRRQEAIDEYREALRLQPGLPIARTLLDLALRGPAVEEGAHRE
jgi:protein O-mannosyl-transferase